ncbi:GntR family transcriptional regulator [Candidatus Saccharibacteria bacterium]|nr:GntR family transcriptional regulator [Candidatus Saccharibacteria bacterium]
MQFVFDNERPIYLQLVEQLRLMIASGQCAAGSRLPSVRELASQARVNPNTMQKALQELEDQQLIFTERTNGKFVTEDQKLIAKYKKQLASAAAKTYLADTKRIGVSFEEAINILQEIGGGR